MATSWWLYYSLLLNHYLVLLDLFPSVFPRQSYDAYKKLEGFVHTARHAYQQGLRICRHRNMGCLLMWLHPLNPFLLMSLTSVYTVSVVYKPLHYGIYHYTPELIHSKIGLQPQIYLEYRLVWTDSYRSRSVWAVHKSHFSEEPSPI